MNLNQYQAEAQYTKSNEYFGKRISKAFFLMALTSFVTSAERLDAIKKSLFYGKDNPHYAVNGEVNNDPEADKVHDCNHLQMHRLHNEVHAGLDILHGIIGKATESAELISALYDVLSPEHINPTLDHVNILEEIGDGFWYDAIILKAIDSDFHAAAWRNNQKLKKRFPNKFTTQDAIVRDLQSERATLESKDETAAEMLQRLGTDADLWAKELNEHLESQLNTNFPTNNEDRIDTLRAWFANAIEAGRSAGLAKVSETIGDGTGEPLPPATESSRIGAENAG